MTISRAREILGDKASTLSDDDLARHINSLNMIAEIAAKDIIEKLSLQNTAVGGHIINHNSKGRL